MDHTIAMDQANESAELAAGLELIEATLLNNISGGGCLLDGIVGNCLQQK